MEKLNYITKKLDDHEIRIRKLEINDAEMGQKIQNLIDKIDNLTGWLKALVLLGISTLVGFFIWYIQNLGR
ncbi:MAG: hemolysin XhlA family protein [Thermosipho sp. (in: Bacteria)]|nr:hemolysin XhlA family protein [Thermosipho sp. (in: thermotogales)]